MGVWESLNHRPTREVSGGGTDGSDDLLDDRADRSGGDAMSKLTGIYVGGAVAGLLLILWVVNGQSVDRLIEYVQGDWKTVLLAAQIIALFVTALLRRYVASVILLFTTVLTVMGVLV